MPELPEVETIRRTLEALILTKQIEKVTVNWPKMIKLPEKVDQFKDELVGETIEKIGRRGKFLIFYTNHFALVSHLRMEGRYGLYGHEEEVEKHTHVIFHFTDGTELRYRDVRKFGTMHLFHKGKELITPPISKLGPEPLSADFTVGILEQKLRKTSRGIKAALLDQTTVAGLGNIYVDEVLFCSGIHPEKKANSLTKGEVELLHSEIIATLNEAVAKGGSTIRSYVNSQGEIGMFQLELKVYGRKGKPCKVCSTPLERIVAGGRGTVFCPKCQRRE